MADGSYGRWQLWPTQLPVALDLVMAYVVMADGSYGLHSYPSLSKQNDLSHWVVPGAYLSETLVSVDVDEVRHVAMAYI